MSVVTSLSVSHAQELPHVYLVDPATVRATKLSYARGESNSAVTRLLADADKVLAQPPVSVTEKTGFPPSGDKHDYMSVAPYWWPDTTKPGGEPYIRRDGIVNPDRYTIGDRERIGTMMNGVWTLSLAWYISGKPEYADHAIRFLRVWFLDADTRMNPNLEYAQVVRGRDLGRGIGIIDAYGLRTVIDGLGLLEECPAWTEQDREGVKDWFRKYLDWLLTSDHGVTESKEKNNHGTLYAVQASTIALFVGRDSLARAMVYTAGVERIGSQIEPDGSQPFEVVRSKSFNYSLFNLEGLMQLALIGDHVGVNLWSYEADDGRSIRKAIDFLIPFALGTSYWQHEQITRMEVERLVPILRIAAVHYQSRRYAELETSIPTRNREAQRTTLLFPDYVTATTK